jgi:hypothetical protein
MNRLLSTIVGVGAIVGILNLVRNRQNGGGSPARDLEDAAAAAGPTLPAGEGRVERFDGGQTPLATGRADEVDALGGAAHNLPPVAAMDARAAARHVRGKNTNTDREGMYSDAADDVATSGSQGNDLGRENQNPIGRHG